MRGVVIRRVGCTLAISCSSVFHFIVFFKFSFSRFSCSLAGLNVPPSHVAVSGVRRILSRSLSRNRSCRYSRERASQNFYEMGVPDWSFTRHVARALLQGAPRRCPLGAAVALFVVAVVAANSEFVTENDKLTN